MKISTKLLFVSLLTIGFTANSLNAKAEFYADEAAFTEAEEDQSGWDAQDFEEAFRAQAKAIDKKKRIPGRPPRGGSATTWGNNKYYSDGGGSFTWGDNTYFNKGGSSFTWGDNTYYSKGDSSFTWGSNTYFSKGGSSFTWGDTTYFSDGRKCFTWGSSEYCS
ncbi:MAG: hypothetical protein EOP11_16745 [Proteobacteria bacterium]|nr:MAG: hypothetical protein EOP11_16745 [Pseudomonadota bacterium]